MLWGKNEKPDIEGQVFNHGNFLSENLQFPQFGE